MGIADDAVEIRAQGWRTLAALHGLIEAALERALSGEHELSVVEYTVLDALSRQDGWHMRMQPARPRRRAVRQRHHPAGHPARGPRAAHPDLCADDRRGIYTELTPAGPGAARPGPADPRPHARAPRSPRPASGPSWRRSSTRCTGSPAPA